MPLSKFLSKQKTMEEYKNRDRALVEDNSSDEEDEGYFFNFLNVPSKQKNSQA